MHLPPVVWIAALVACGRSNVVTPVTVPVASAPTATSALTSCERQQMAPGERSVMPERVMLIIQASGPAAESIARFDVDLIEDASSILPSVILQCSPGIVVVYGLRAVVPATPLDIVVAAPGYLPQRRRTALGPGTNSAYFILGKPGMQFYQRGDIQIPYSRARARYLVLVSPGHGSHSQPDPASPAWYRGVVEAEPVLHGDGAERKRAIRDLASHLREHPEQGTLVVLLSETTRGGSWFTGEIEVTFRTRMDRDQLAAFTATYDLVVERTENGRTTFAMKTPDADFPDLLDRIKAENDVVSEIDPVVSGTIEIDSTR